MAMRYAARKGARTDVQQLARVEGFAYPLLLPARSRMRARTAVLVLVGLVLLGAAVAASGGSFGTSLNDQKAACLARPVEQRAACLQALAGSISTIASPYPWLVLVATLVTLAIASYVTVAVVRLIDERRRLHAALLVEARLARLEGAFVAGDVSETTYGILRQWLRGAGTLDADGDDAIQAGRVGRALALFAFPLSLLPMLALYASAALRATPGTGLARGATQAASELAANPLLSSPILETALAPAKDLLRDANGAIDLAALVPVTAPALSVTVALWIATSVLTALLLTIGGHVRDREDERFEESWHMVLLAARDRSGDPARLPLEEGEEKKMAA